MPMETLQTTAVTSTETPTDIATQSKAEDGPGFDTWQSELGDEALSPSKPTDGAELTSSDGERGRAGDDASPATRRDGDGDGAVEKDAAQEATQPRTTKQDENKKLEETTKTESKVDKQLKIETPVQQKTPADTQKISGRNYEGLTPEEAAVFKKMGNEAYNMLLPIFKEHKQLKQTLTLKDQEITNLKSGKEQLPPSYYEHPDAYQLTQTYREATQLVQGAEAIYNHWRRQMIAAESGEDWQGLKKAEDGSIILGDKFAVTPESKVALQENLEFARKQLNQVSSDLNNVREQFKQNHDKIHNFVKRDMEDAYFPFYKKEELDKPHMAEHKKMIDDVINAMPDELRGNMLAQPLAKAFSFVMHMNKQNEELRKKIEILETKSSDRTKAQPTRGDTVAPHTTKEGPSMDDFIGAMDS